MAVDKLVDSTQLDADLTSVANAIRTKGGTSADLAFPAGFVSAVEAIETGGGGEEALPSGYTRLKYLQSSGTQYIDTGLHTKENQRYIVTSNFANGNIMGNNASGCQMFFQKAGSIYYQFGSAAYKVFNFYPANFSFQVAMDKEGCYVYDYAEEDYVKLATISDTTVTENANVHNILFGRSNSATQRQLSSNKIYYFACEEDGVPIRKMYPCIRESDDVLGMYDTVNNVFYANAGAGSFTGGTYD